MSALELTIARLGLTRGISIGAVPRRTPGTLMRVMMMLIEGSWSVRSRRNGVSGICERTEVYYANSAWYIYMYARTPGTAVRPLVLY